MCSDSITAIVQDTPKKPAMLGSRLSTMNSKQPHETAQSCDVQAAIEHAMFKCKVGECDEQLFGYDSTNVVKRVKIARNEAVVDKTTVCDYRETYADDIRPAATKELFSEKIVV